MLLRFEPSISALSIFGLGPQSVQNTKASPGWTTIALGLSSSFAAIIARWFPSRLATSTLFVPESVQKRRLWTQSTAIPPGESKPEFTIAETNVLISILHFFLNFLSEDTKVPSVTKLEQREKFVDTGPKG